MAKRGETRPYRMTFTWPSGIKGIQTFTTEEAALFAAHQQAAWVGPEGDRCRVVVTRRGQDAPLLTLKSSEEDNPE